MNMTQMKYFLTLGRTLNFTKASDILFITQPALSRQISLIEKELNMQLFVRTSHTVRLTPAGSVLMKEFETIYNAYNVAIANAKSCTQVQLRIGVLEGLNFSDILAEIHAFFGETYPNVKISVNTYSFKVLIQKLYEDQLELVFTHYYHVKEHNIQKLIIERTKDYVAVSKNHRLAKATHVMLTDFIEDTFIVTAPDECKIVETVIRKACLEKGFVPKIVYASSVVEGLFLAESGVGICFVDSRSVMNSNENVCLLEIDSISEPWFTMAWCETHYNPYLDIVVEHISEKE